MNILRKDKSIRSTKFKCLTYNRCYEILGTSSTLGELSSFRDNVTRCIDKVKRLSDNKIEYIKREDLGIRFNNIEL
tara:strand:+ start:169 stop:396 length:228 start_codon:yes stop_codon:yes gene_type:complete